MIFRIVSYASVFEIQFGKKRTRVRSTTKRSSFCTEKYLQKTKKKNVLNIMKQYKFAVLLCMAAMVVLNVTTLVRRMPVWERNGRGGGIIAHKSEVYVM